MDPCGVRERHSETQSDPFAGSFSDSSQLWLLPALSAPVNLQSLCLHSSW